MRPLALLPLLALLAACSDYGLNREGKHGPGGDDTSAPADDGVDTGSATPGDCTPDDREPEEIGVADTCPEPVAGGFDPVVEWSYGAGKGCLSLPLVADLDGDGLPEVILNVTGFFNGPGTLTVLRGDGGALVWEDTGAQLAYGSPPAVGDLDGDGSPEIVVVREYTSGLMTGQGDYRAAAYAADGTELWETDAYTALDFDWATAPVISDMDHDGSPEIVVGRVILDATGAQRGKGIYGRGSYGVTQLGTLVVSEATVPAVADLDLDGVEEVITGNAAYAPDGTALWYDATQNDGMVSVVNLDGDPEGEFVAITGNTIRAVDTHGAVLWGPVTVETANILATVAVADLDLDGLPELVTAGGNQLVVFNHDGTALWTAPVTDESGATGASVFDFEGDGQPEVVYIDEVQMVAYDGSTGAVKFHSTEHASNTMFDYPVIADVDGDDQAEVLVCHNGYSSALSVYGDAEERWPPVRRVWNQHAYGISNINDDLSVPVEATPSFSDTNTWHSAIATLGEELSYDLEAEILDVCEEECGAGRVLVTARLRNASPEALEAGVGLALYAQGANGDVLVARTDTPDLIDAAHAGASVTFEVPASRLEGATGLWLVADDDGTGTGAIAECSESNNGVLWSGPFCE